MDLTGLDDPPLPPFAENVVELADGRDLAFAQYGDPDGEVVIWCHGTPGARHQVPPDAPGHAEQSGIRIIVPDRPGVGGSSTDHDRTLLSWADDVEQLLDDAGVERFAVAGLSGGGPHVLAIAHEFPDRATAGALLGGMVPLSGPDAPPSTPDIVPLAMDVAHRLRFPLGSLMSLLLRPITPELGEKVFPFALKVLPENDRAILGSDGFRTMFINDLWQGSRDRFRAQSHDISAFGTNWGFSPRGITIPIKLWHGTEDLLVPLSHAEHLVSLIPQAEIEAFDGEGHFAGYARSPAVLDWLMANHLSADNRVPV